MIDKKLTSNLHTIILNEYENTEGIVILEAGQIVFEEYFGNSNSTVSYTHLTLPTT